MSSPSNSPQKPITAEAVQDWLHAARIKRLNLHLQATAPRNSHQRHEAFMEMSKLLEESFEEVRVISASLREGSQKVRGESADLRAHSTQLMDQSRKSVERTAQFAPRPAEVRAAESRMLDMFKGD